jgi:predicted nucleic acid-binding protein
MSWLYVESNFILELAFAQQQRGRCANLLELSEQRTLDLAIPAFCLAEPLETLGRRHKERRQLQLRLQQTLRQLRRSDEYVEAVRQVDEATQLFVRSRIDERRRLEEVIRRVTATAVLIPLIADTMTAAFQLSTQYDLTPQDALVLASVLAHRGMVDEDGVFVTTNAKDFDDPELRELLNDAGCLLETGFGAAIGHFLG